MMDNNNMQQNGAVQQPGENEGSTLSLRSIWKFFTGNWFWFALSVCLCVGLGYLYCKVSPKVYSASATIYIDENASRSVKSDVTTMSNLRMMRQTSVVDNEAAILQSRSLMEQVVKNLNLNVVYKVQAKLRKVEVYAPAVPAHLVVDSLIRPFSVDMTLAENKVSGVITYADNNNKKRQEFSVGYGEPIYGDMGMVRIERNELIAGTFAERIAANDKYFVSVLNPASCAAALSRQLGVAPTSKTSSKYTSAAKAMAHTAAREPSIRETRNP